MILNLHTSKAKEKPALHAPIKVSNAKGKVLQQKIVPPFLITNSIPPINNFIASCQPNADQSQLAILLYSVKC